MLFRSPAHQQAEQGVQTLLDADPGAMWSPSANGGRGGIVGGCMAAGTCSRSPRWIALPLFNVDAYQQARTAGNENGRQVPITVVKVLGFFLEGFQNNSVVGRLMYYPDTPLTGGSSTSGLGLWVYHILLVR